MVDVSNAIPKSDFPPPSVLCSICLDTVVEGGGRSTARLQCGHKFHLDCIGSAFNFKGAMQCPNCRKVEQGRWLFPSGPTRSLPEMSMDGWVLREDQYGLSYPEIPLNIHWCPFSRLARVPSPFEALESFPPAYHNLHRHHNMIAEQGAASSVPHPYITYLRPIPLASSNTNETIEDPNLSYHWNAVPNPYAFPVTDMHHHNAVLHSHANSTDQAQVAPVTLRSSRGDFGAMTRSGPYMHPFLFGHGSQSHERLHSSHTIHHPHQSTNPLSMPSTIIPSMARFHGRRALPQPPIPANPVSISNGGFFIIPPQGSLVPSSHETENSLPVISSDRDSGINQTGNFWHRHWS